MPDKFNEADIHNALALGVTKDKAKQLREYHMDGKDIFVGGRFGEDGKYRSDYDLFKSTADTQEYREDFLEKDLEQFKKNQVRKNNKDGKFYDGHGNEHPNANINPKVRANIKEAYKRAGIEDEREINRIMYAKDWPDYIEKKEKRNKKKTKPFESALDSVKTPKEIPTPSTKPIEIPKYSHLDQKINTALTKEVAPVVQPVIPQRQPEGIQKLTKQINQVPPKPDVSWREDKGPKGLSYLMGVSDD